MSPAEFTQPIQIQRSHKNTIHIKIVSHHYLDNIKIRVMGVDSHLFSRGQTQVYTHVIGAHGLIR